jgi:PAS domain S-box-containing protein
LTSGSYSEESSEFRMPLSSTQRVGRVRLDQTIRGRVLARITADQLAEILDITEDGIVTVDARQEIVLFNRGAVKIFGHAPEEVVGQPLELLLPSRFQSAHRGQVEEFGRSPASARLMGERREVYGRRKDGTEFPAEVSISKFGSGGRMLFTAIIRDVTERRTFEASERELEQLRGKAKLAEAEAAARESETQYRQIVETANEGIWLLDANAQITFVNAQMAEMLGYQPEEMRGRHKWDFLFDEDQEVVRQLWERRRTGISEQADVRFRHRSGAAVWTLMSARPLTGNQGEFLGALDMFTDVTERKRAENAVRETSEQRERTLAELQTRTEELRATTQQLWQAARLAGVGELAASIAHELNNPLGTVSLRIENVLYKTPQDDPRRKLLEVIDGEVERMAGLVANLLQFSRAGRDQVSTVDVCEEINKTLELVSHHLRKRRVKVATDFARGVPAIHADRQQLRQVFLNLFTNAADAMPEGGQLAPRVRSAELPGGIPAIEIEVADSGAGIPKDLLSRVFDPFFTTKEEGKGTGLGLAICKRIIAEHHGTMGIESEVGHGTKVRVTIPVHPETNVAELQSKSS